MRLTDPKLLLSALAALGVVTSAAAAPPSSTNLLRARQDDHTFQVFVVPAAPTPGALVTVQLDLTQVPAVPDPAYGDRVPVREASLVAVLRRNGTEAMRLAMHPVEGAGRYGFHWTPRDPGLYELTFERRDGDLPKVGFKVGVGVETPAQDLKEDSPIIQGYGFQQGPQQSRRTTASIAGPITPMGAGPSAPAIMEAVEPAAVALSESLAAAHPDLAAVKAHLATLAEEAGRLPGTVPPAHAGTAEGYDALAKALQERLSGLQKAAEASDVKALRIGWRQTLDDTCARCHTQYWWELTEDLSSWPEIAVPAGK